MPHAYSSLPPYEEALIPSPLAEYLSDKAVQHQLLENIAHFFDLATIKNNSVSLISRYFNQLPKKHPRIQLLLDSIKDAILCQQFSVWLNFAIAIALDDLFNEEGSLRNDVFESLNHKNTLSEIIRNFPEDQVKSQLLSAYIVEIIGEHAADIVGNMDNSGTDPFQTPNYLYSHTSNVRLNEITRVDQALIHETLGKLSLAVSDSNFKPENLKKYITCYVEYTKSRNNLLHALKKPHHDAELIKLGKHILVEIEKVKSHLMPDDEATLLLNTLNLIHKMLTEPYDADNIKDCRALATLLHQRPWGRLIANGLLALTGTFVFFVSGAALVTLPTTVAVVGGASAAGSTGLGAAIAGNITLFRLAKETPLVQAIEKFANTAENHLKM